MAIVAGAVANWVMMIIAFSIWFDLTSNTASNPTLHAGLWAFGLMAALAGLALTTAGESFFRFLNGCRQPIRAEEEKLRPAFEDVCASAEIDPKNYDLFISDDKFPNAFAMGRRTVCVTRTLLNSADDEELQGVLAHELGHHVNGDTVRGMVFYMITLVGQIIMWGGWLITKILGGLRVIAGAGGKQEKEAAQIFTIFSGIMWVIMWFFQIFVWVPIWIGSAFGSRQQEYKADLFAAQIGHSDGLLSFLNGILDIDGHPSGFMGLLQRTHPKTGDRIRKLEDYVEQEDTAEAFNEVAEVI